MTTSPSTPRFLYGALALLGTIVVLLSVTVVLADGDDPPRVSGSRGDCDLTVPPRALPDATETVASGSVVCVEDGIYDGSIEVTRDFESLTTFRALNPYRVEVRSSGTALTVSGASNVAFEGFRLRHQPDATGYVAYVRGSDTHGPAEDVILRDNVIHDGRANDLLKVHNGARDVLVEGNMFYNQAPGEQHMDINSAVAVTIRGNVMFNTAGGPSDDRPRKHFIVIKGSNPGVGGVLGSRRVAVTDNVLFNFQGGDEAWIAVGNDGKAYPEATSVSIERNLLLGNSAVTSFTPLQVMGAGHVTFARNQVLGDLPSSYYGIRAGTKDENPPNGPVTLTENTWADPTGTMEDFAKVEDTPRFLLSGNLFWNGSNPLPADVTVDPDATITDPGVPDQGEMVLPVWEEDGFASGSPTIAEERERLVRSYGLN